MADGREEAGAAAVSGSDSDEAWRSKSSTLCERLLATAEAETEAEVAEVAVADTVLGPA